jgi:O-acetyl-ADP-ribose deacetylase (regulator of RNase III)
MNIKYLKGDATLPIGDRNKIIVHVCNDIGAWGKGFVLAISKRWKEPEKKYKEWVKSGNNFNLGEVQFVQVEPTIWVANLIGQKDIKKDSDGKPPVRYFAIKLGLAKVGYFARQINAFVHMPRIGCGLAGGNWDQIEPAISHELLTFGIETVVYDFDER